MSERTGTERIGVMICGHGSRDEAAVREFNHLAQVMRKTHPEYAVESGFLEFARPIIRDGLDKLKAEGVSHILAIPAMLFAAGHVKNDLPWEVNAFAAENPQIKVEFGRELGVDPKMLAAARARVEEAMVAADEAQGPVSPGDTLLLVVGRGTTDPDANSNVAKVTRMLWEGLGLGWAETAFSGVAYPLVDAALARAVRLGFKRIVVFPYFLFTGILVRRIYTWADEAAAAHPAVQIVKAPYLNDHPLVVDSFAERVRDTLAGNTAMNCAVCKYRIQVIGYEDDVGAVQAGHHHHVRGAGTDGEGAADHGVHHGHHHHGHHHHGHHHHDHGHGHGHAHPHDHGHDHDHPHDHDHDHGPSHA